MIVERTEQEEAYDDFIVLYLRLLHDYEKLKQSYEHARAAIDNDLWAETQHAKPRESECPF